MGTAVFVSGGLSQFMSMVSPMVGLFIRTSGFDVVIACLGMAVVIPGAMLFFLTREGY